ncbi:MAG: LysR substrate-binding domain-containing protein [Comamonadaceae bacterium]|nr:LysR substrate-binding domain-containing protein [Comamonadaceae bacterium]
MRGHARATCSAPARRSTPADLARHECLTLSSDASQTRGWAFAVDGAGDAPAARAAGWTAATARCCTTGACAGLGIAWRSTWEVEHDIAAGRLVAVLDDFAAPPNGIYAVFPQRKHLPLRVRLWIDFLKHSYGDPALLARAVRCAGTAAARGAPACGRRTGRAALRAAWTRLRGHASPCGSACVGRHGSHASRHASPHFAWAPGLGARRVGDALLDEAGLRRAGKLLRRAGVAAAGGRARASPRRRGTRSGASTPRRAAPSGTSSPSCPCAAPVIAPARLA